VGLGFLIFEVSRSHSDTPHSVGLLWTSDRLVAETSTGQHITLTRDWHPRSRREFEPAIPASKRTTADPRLRPHGHWDRQYIPYQIKILLSVLYGRKTYSLSLKENVCWRLLACFWLVTPIVTGVCCWYFWESQCPLLHGRTFTLNLEKACSSEMLFIIIIIIIIIIIYCNWVFIRWQ
jgi:hypothetical protein